MSQTYPRSYQNTPWLGEMAVNILVVSDLHWDMSQEEVGLLQRANDICQLCVCLGDIPLDQLRLVFRNVLIPTVGVLGNHDVFGLLGHAGIEDIHGRSVSIAGLQVAGIGGCPRYKDDFDSPLYSQTDSLVIERELEQQPPADLLICHSSPFHFGQDRAHRGFLGISRYMRRMRPAYVIHGHDHESKAFRREYAVSKRGRSATTVVCSYRVQMLQVDTIA